MANAMTGWERERRGHFDEIVADYDRARPSYPAALIADVVRYADPTRGAKALEIGPGTGKATAAILDAGYDVTGIELGANMAAFLGERFAGRAGFRVIVAGFEDVALDEGAFDLVYAASAFHWLDADVAAPKAFRLLRAGGAIALLRYNVLRARNAALDRDVRAAYAAHYDGFYTSHRHHGDRDVEDFQSPALLREGYGVEDLGAYGFADVTLKLYEATLSYDPDGYIALLDTLADHRALPEGNRAALYADIRGAIERHGGCYAVDHVFQLYMGRRP